MIGFQPNRLQQVKPVWKFYYLPTQVQAPRLRARAYSAEEHKSLQNKIDEIFFATSGYTNLCFKVRKSYPDCAISNEFDRKIRHL